MTPPRNFPFISPRTSAPPGRGVSRRRYRLRFIRQENRNVHGNAAIPQRVFRRDGIELEPKAPPAPRLPLQRRAPAGGGLCLPTTTVFPARRNGPSVPRPCFPARAALPRTPNTEPPQSAEREPPRPAPKTRCCCIQGPPGNPATQRTRR